MATDSVSDPQIEITRLQDEVTRLQNRLEELEAQRTAEREALRRVGWFGLKVFVGGDLRQAFQAWIEAKTLREPLPSAETADLAAALVRRMVRVSLVGLVVAVLPTALLFWQNWEIRQQSGLLRVQHSEALDLQSRLFLSEIKAQATLHRETVANQAKQHQASLGLIQEQISAQSDQHMESLNAQAQQLELFRRQVVQTEADTMIVRRAQLLATIYDCEEPQADRICLPRAHPRARAEAIKALTEIEQGRGVRPDLTLADLSGLVLRKANLIGVNLGEARLGRADLMGADLRRADLRRADLTEVNLFVADLSKADLSGTVLTEAKLMAADLIEAGLREADLREADLREANLREADLRWADLIGSDLGGADLSEANLVGADLGGADLSGADLSGAKLRETNLGEAGMFGALWSRVALFGEIVSTTGRMEAVLINGELIGDIGMMLIGRSHNLTQDQINSARGNAETILPEGLTHPKHWIEPEPEQVAPPDAKP